MQTIRLFDLTIGSATAAGLIALTRDNRRNGRAGYLATLDLLGLDRSLTDQAYRQSLKDADRLVLDGAGVLLLARLLGRPAPNRTPGADLFVAMSALAANESLSLFFYGARRPVLDRLVRRLRKDHPTLRISGALDGYSVDTVTAAEVIARTNPDLLFVALGVPRQEKFLHEFADKMGVPLSIGVGGSFDVASGTLRRAPVWLQNIGLEWLFRLIQEPGRARRIARIPGFLAETLLDVHFGKVRP